MDVEEFHLSESNLTYFPLLKDVKVTASFTFPRMWNWIPNSKYIFLICNFMENKLALFSSSPSSITDSVNWELQIEVIELQCNITLKVKWLYLFILNIKHCAVILSVFRMNYQFRKSFFLFWNWIQLNIKIG